MKTSAYVEKLQDPRWQRKRLEILNRDEWTCAACCATDRQLHVHHRYYRPDTEPWEYPDSTYVTFCHECHAEWNDRDKQSRGRLLEVACAGDANFDDAITLIETITKKGCDLLEVAYLVYLLDIPTGVATGTALHRLQIAAQDGRLLAIMENRDR